jgi:hypothetical protein
LRLLGRSSLAFRESFYSSRRINEKGMVKRGSS